MMKSLPWVVSSPSLAAQTAVALPQQISEAADEQDATSVKGWKHLRDPETGRPVSLWEMKGSPESNYLYVLTDKIDSRGNPSNVKVRYSDSYVAFACFLKDQDHTHQYTIDIRDGKPISAYNADTKRLVPVRQDETFVYLTTEEGSEYRINKVRLNPEKIGLSTPPPPIEREDVFKEYAPLWNMSLPLQSVLEDGTRLYKGSPGPEAPPITRMEFSDGSKCIPGITHKGQLYNYHQGFTIDGRIRELFLRDTKALSFSLKDDSQYEQILAQMRPWEEQNHLAHQEAFREKPDISYTTFKPGMRGSQYTLLEIPSGDREKMRFHLISESPLKPSTAGNLMHLLGEPPECIFKYALGETRDMNVYIVDRIGKVEVLGERYSDAVGVVRASNAEHAVTLLENRINTPPPMGKSWIFVHELGHRADTLHGGISSKARDSDGNKLFGSGEFTCSKNKSQTHTCSDFVTPYATTDASEDFAETFAFTSLLIHDFGKTGGDFLTVPNDSKKQILQEMGIPHRLAKKILCITSLLQHSQ